jgi:hypothetical protein
MVSHCVDYPETAQTKHISVVSNFFISFEHLDAESTGMAFMPQIFIAFSFESSY